ncbi:methylmalonyl Co-A mutase-associated GTPase MeaB [Thermovenabulum gondwanense]|uniref:Putative GTPase n=1 Tax=Thermovenabulum gondwanense TaxID=520767 RepID=A0A161PYU6_9FIRM|nr:methylmalonyl Co-A mutase-associated GTPase MeaB [Thermovenabulum gondwanense]KYO67616.1 putative GTPase [Thermovenabulum gondwanense]
MHLYERILNKDKRAVARLITLIENQTKEAREELKYIYKNTGNAKIIGITGPPGAGKSSLVNELVKTIRKEGKTVGVIAVDPTSPFSGGAILGDRIRMNEISLDPGVYIRSMGSRGSLGGIAKAAFDAVKVLDAYGMDYIIIETVGVGQSEVDIVKLADTVVLVLVPGLGDDVQAIKAGIMEIADIFAINKADKEGADRLIIEIQMMLDIGMKESSWRPPVLKTVALSGMGVPELFEEVKKHLEFQKNNGLLEEKRMLRIKEEFYNHLKDMVAKEILEKKSQKIKELLKDIEQKKLDPYSAVEIIISKINIL